MLALALILLIVAVAGGVLIHPLFFALLILAILALASGRRAL